MSWVDGYWGALDTETGGVDVENDQIVTVCVGEAYPGKWEPQNWLIAVDKPIAAEASAVHGITTEHAQQHGRPAGEVLEEVEAALYGIWATGAPIVAYNAVFDFSILDRNLRRHLDRPLQIRGPVIDPLTLDRLVDRYRKGSRKLQDVCAHWGVPLTEEDAHSAHGDAFAALRLAWHIITRGDFVVSGNGRGPTPVPLLSFSLPELQALQVSAYSDQRRSFFDYLAKKGETPDDTNTRWPLKPWNGAKA